MPSSCISRRRFLTQSASAGAAALAAPAILRALETKGRIGLGFIASGGRARANLTAELAGLRGRDRTPRVGGTVPLVDAPETVAEAVALLEAEGYTGDVRVSAGTARCEACATAHPFDRLVADHVFRFEGMSNPSDEAIVIGVTCPACGTRSVLVSAYGPDADPDELAGVRMVAERYAG